MVNAVQNVETQQRNHLGRSIEDGNMAAILRIVNKAMYSFPVASAIRETVTNALDGVLEKQNAIDIITGKKKEEDIYVKRTENDPQYKHSVFDRAYYDLNYLSSDNNVYVNYIEGDGVGPDMLEIKDFGVGLSDVEGLSGKPRLIGIHMSSFSTKRNSFGTFGAFGLGAKSPLAMAKYYLLETVYNGRRYLLRCGEHYTNSEIGPFSNGKANGKFTYTDGNTTINWYYEPTNQPNQVIVKIPCKPIERQEVDTAIKQQLLFMDNVKYSYQKYQQSPQNVEFHGKKLYESKNIIISENSTYSVPHIIIVKEDAEVHTNAVCYGPINWAKLEMPVHKGCVGIKVPVRVVSTDDEGNVTVLREGVEVTPSRETVIWNDVTAKVIKQKIEDVKAEINAVVKEKLKTDNIFEFIRIKSSIQDSMGSKYQAISELAKLINPEDWDLSFKGLQLSSLVYFTKSLKTNKNGVKYVSSTFNTGFAVSKIAAFPIYFVPADVEVDNKTVRYLVTKHKSNLHFIYASYDTMVANLTATDKEALTITPESYKEFIQFVKSSGEATLFSNDIPEDYVEESDPVEQPKPVQLSPKELRELEDKVLINVPAVAYIGFNQESPYQFVKTDIKKKDLLAYGVDAITEGSVCYYGTVEYEADLLLTMSLVQPLHRRPDNRYSAITADLELQKNVADHNSKVYSTKQGGQRFIMVSKAVEKMIAKLPNYKHITTFNANVTNENNIVKMELAEDLIKYNTARYLYPKIQDLQFMLNYESIDRDISSKFYKIYNYISTYYISNPFGTYYYRAWYDKAEMLHTSLDRLNEAQLTIRNSIELDKEQSLEYVKSILGLNPEVKSLQIIGLDLDYVDLTEELLEYAKGIKGLLNNVGILCNADQPTIENETVALIKLFIKTVKG